jgi:hypothetical protein
VAPWQSEESNNLYNFPVCSFVPPLLGTNCLVSVELIQMASYAVFGLHIVYLETVSGRRKIASSIDDDVINF